MYRIAFITTITVILIGPELLFAQDYTFGPVQVKGSAGFSTELYGVSGIDSRRPPASGRLFANLTAEGPGFRYGLDMNLSTKQSSIRQNLNQLGLNASYRCATAPTGRMKCCVNTCGKPFSAQDAGKKSRLFRNKSEFSAFSDVSTGEFALSQVLKADRDSLLQSFQPSEVLLQKRYKNNLAEEATNTT